MDATPLGFKRFCSPAIPKALKASTRGGRHPPPRDGSAPVPGPVGGARAPGAQLRIPGHAGRGGLVCELRSNSPWGLPGIPGQGSMLGYRGETPPWGPLNTGGTLF